MDRGSISIMEEMLDFQKKLGYKWEERPVVEGDYLLVVANWLSREGDTVFAKCRVDMAGLKEDVEAIFASGCDSLERGHRMSELFQEKVSVEFVLRNGTKILMTPYPYGAEYGIKDTAGLYCALQLSKEALLPG